MWYNSMVNWILRSPLHPLVSRNFMIISFTGRKSGKPYETPVNYVRDGDCLTVTSLRQRTWWRNLIGGAPVTLRLQGREVKAFASAAAGDPEVVTRELLAYLSRTPQVAKYFHVSLDQNGKPVKQDVVKAAEDRVVVKVQLAKQEGDV